MEKLQKPIVPQPMKDAIEANSELKQALQETELPIRFQAMVLGLSTLRQMNPEANHDQPVPPNQR